MSSTGLSRERFLDYIRAFNTRDYQAQHAFYDESVTLEVPDPAIGILHGSKGITDHYAIVHGFAEETVVPIVVLVDRNRIFFIMETYFKYKSDTDQAVHGHTVKAGDVLRMTVWAYYEIKDAKMTRIVCNLYKDEFLGQADVKAHIKESEGRADEDIRLYNY